MSALEHEYNDGRKNNMTVRDSGIRYHIPHYIILCARMVHEMVSTVILINCTLLPITHYYSVKLNTIAFTCWT
jgi:hypothetical protein